MIDFDLAPMLDAHLRSGAVATIAAMTREPDEVAEKYGVMLVADDGRITDFVEKPTLAELREHFRAETDEDFRRLPLMTNAGFYLIDTTRIRDLAAHPEIDELRRTRLDFGKDLLPWLVGNGHKVMVQSGEGSSDLETCATTSTRWSTRAPRGFRAVDRLLGRPSTPSSMCGSRPGRSRCATRRAG
jgi:NDP-sugar pyrophosphorylase family protein